MSEDGTLTISEADLLGSSIDPENDVLHIENLELGAGASGTLTLDDESAAEGTRTWTFTPVADFNGSVSLSYEVSDGELTDTVNTSITVTPVDDILTGNAIDGYMVRVRRFLRMRMVTVFLMRVRHLRLRVMMVRIA